MLIEQHHHGLASGEFARHWADGIRPREAVLYAIANHDVAWHEPDREVRWNDEAKRPHSFVDYPVGPKLRAYAEGIDLIESQNPYAAYLCSMHYGSFMQDAPEEVAFAESEAGRRRRIEANLSDEEMESLDYNFRLLQLCDDLSLFVCLNEPGVNDHPWYRDGFGFMGTRLAPVWEDERTLRLEPNPFSEPFAVRIPFQIVGRDRRQLASDLLELRVTCQR